MKIYVRLLFLLLLALALAGFSKFNGGTVSIYLANYRADLNLNLLLGLWLLSFAFFYYLLRLYINLRHLQNKIRRSRLKNALIISRRHLNFAGLHYFEGNYHSCYNDALKSVSKELSPDNKFLAYALALRAANIMRDQDKEEKLLLEINQLFAEPKWQLAKNMLLAKNSYNLQNYGQSIDHLNNILQFDHKHIPARRMLLKVYVDLGNYQQASELLNGLLKNETFK